MEENTVLEDTSTSEAVQSFEDSSVGMSSDNLSIKQIILNNKGYLTFAAVITSFLILTAGALYFVINKDANSTRIVSEEKEAEILMGVIRNNPASLIDNKYNSAQDSQSTDTDTTDSQNVKKAPKYQPPSNPANPAEDSPIPVPDVTQDGAVGDISDQIVVPDLDVYNYRHTTITVVPGQASNACGFYSYMDNEVEVSEYYEYFDLNRSYYMDEVSLDGELDRYYLGKYSTTESEYINYQGGDIAAKLLFDIYPEYSNEYKMDPVSYPSYPVSYPLSEIEYYFGNNAAVTDMEEIDGVTYYDITTYYYSSCNYYGASYPQHKFITIYKIDSRDFTIVEAKRFIDSISESTLIYVTTTEIDRDKVAYDEVSEYFTFNYDADVLDVNYRDYEYNPDTAFVVDMQYLDEQNQNLVFPNLDSNTLQYFTGRDLAERVENQNYYYLREFYPATTKGEKKYEDIMYYHNQSPLYWTGFLANYDRYGYISIDIYDSKRSVDELLYAQTGDSSDAVQYRDVQVMVNGETLGAKMVTMEHFWTYGYHISYPTAYPVSYSASYPVSYAVSYPASYPGGYTYRFVTSYLAYEYNDQVILMSNYGYDDDYLLNQPYTSAQVGESSFIPMYNAIDEAYKGNIGMNYYD